MKLYYHKTTGGAEFLCSNYVVCPNGDREGTFRSAYIVRIDGNIERDAEIFGLCVTGEEEAILAQSQPENGSERLETPNTGTFDEGYDAGFQSALKEMRNV